MFITVWLFISPFIFQFFFLVYTNSIHSLGALQLLGISLEYDIPALGCLDIGHFNKYTSGISYIVMEIRTYSYHVDGTQRYTRLTLFQYYMIVPWCLPIFTAFVPCTQCTPYVDILTWVFMYTKCILMLHISPKKRFIVYTTCIHRVSISRLRPLDIYAFSNITFPIVPVACGCLLVGSTPPWGPGPQ